MKKDPEIFLGHMLDSIEIIEKTIKGMPKEKFNNSITIQDAIIRRLEIIGEATTNIPNKLKERNQHIPWRIIADFRNVLIHEYFGVDTDLVWKVIKRDLPNLKRDIIKILDDF